MSLQSAEAVEVAVSAVALDHNSAAHALGLSPSRLREHVRLGELIPHFSGTKPLYLVADLERFIEQLPTRPISLPKFK